MRILQTLITIFLLVFSSCNKIKTDTTNEIENVDSISKVDSISIDTILKSVHKSDVFISDSIKKFEVDDYPITNKMLSEELGANSSYKKKSGQIYSSDKIWFGNDTINEVLVFELYTDYHRMLTYHFYNKKIPTDLINRMELHIDGGELASEKQKQIDFYGLLNQTIQIKSTYFISNNDFRLGDTKQKAIDCYGKPDKQSMNNGIEILEWVFIGEIFYDGKTDLKGKPLAKDSFGHQIIMYFKNEKLIGQILQNDIP